MNALEHELVVTAFDLKGRPHISGPLSQNGGVCDYDPSLGRVHTDSSPQGKLNYGNVGV